eukprot:863066-Pleurochrysis_carterae.AAC.2
MQRGCVRYTKRRAGKAASSACEHHLRGVSAVERDAVAAVAKLEAVHFAQTLRRSRFSRGAQRNAANDLRPAPRVDAFYKGVSARQFP